MIARSEKERRMKCGICPPTDSVSRGMFILILSGFLEGHFSIEPRVSERSETPASLDGDIRLTIGLQS